MIAFADPAAITGPVALEALRAVADVGRQDDRCSVATLGEVIVLHRAVSPKDKARWKALARKVIDEVRSATGQGILAIRSKTCLAIADYPSAFRECGRVVELGRRFGRMGGLTAQDFGPLPFRLAAVDTPVIGDFVHDLVGGVTQHDRAHGTAYLDTLSSYLDHGCRAQACAAALGLHVTTLRYRLNRLRELFGLAFETPDERFALQLALRFRFVLSRSLDAEHPAASRKRARRKLV